MALSQQPGPFRETGTWVSLAEKGPASLSLSFLTRELGITILLLPELLKGIKEVTLAENRSPG